MALAIYYCYNRGTMKHDYWHKKKSLSFKVPTLSRKFILKDYIFEMMGPLKGKNLLELGCGSGFWLKLFNDEGAICTGVDIAPEQIYLAQKELSSDIQLFVADAGSFKSSKKFDIVYIDHVLSETSSVQSAVGILRSVKSLLSENGRLILNEMHPSIAHFPFEHTQVSKSYFYFQSGAKLRFEVKQSNGEFIKLTDYHWTLQDYSSMLQQAGFMIEQIIEPQAPKRMVDKYLKLRQKYPSHILIKALMNTK